jgi:hypothetical protein
MPIEDIAASHMNMKIRLLAVNVLKEPVDNTVQEQVTTLIFSVILVHFH